MKDIEQKIYNAINSCPPIVNTQMRVYERIKNVKNKITPKENLLQDILNDLLERENYVPMVKGITYSILFNNLTFSNDFDEKDTSNNQYNQFNNQNISNNISKDRISKMSTNSDKLRQSKIFLEEIQTNNDYLIKRQYELEQIKKYILILIVN